MGVWLQGITWSFLCFWYSLHVHTLFQIAAKVIQILHILILHVCSRGWNDLKLSQSLWSHTHQNPLYGYTPCQHPCMVTHPCQNPLYGYTPSESLYGYTPLSESLYGYTPVRIPCMVTHPCQNPCMVTHPCQNPLYGYTPLSESPAWLHTPVRIPCMVTPLSESPVWLHPYQNPLRGYTPLSESLMLTHRCQNPCYVYRTPLDFTLTYVHLHNYKLTGILGCSFLIPFFLLKEININRTTNITCYT